LHEIEVWAGVDKGKYFNEVASDWRFLTENVERIKCIHTKIGGTVPDKIQRRIAEWSVKRIVQKDIERAEIWAENAYRFGQQVEQVASQRLASKFTTKVKNDLVRKLLETSSFDSDNNEIVGEYGHLIERASELSSNKPTAIRDDAMRSTYKAYKVIEEGISAVSAQMDTLRELLIKLEWVIESDGSKDYLTIVKAKKQALKRNDLNTIVDSLRNVERKAIVWKNDREKELLRSIATIERMARSLGDNKATSKVEMLATRINEINWNKPIPEAVVDALNETASLKAELRQNLVSRLKNEDAIYIIEEPNIVRDLGAEVGWDFNRFLSALSAVLRNGLIEIAVVENK